MNCDGHGSCVDAPPRACGAYACFNGACLETCSTDQDCGAGYRCRQSTCVSGGATECSTDGAASIGADGRVTACGAYACNPAAGLCRSACRLDSDCASGNACDDATNTCVAKGPSADTSGGCGCRTAGNGGGGGATWLLLAGLALCGVRRRA